MGRQEKRSGSGKDGSLRREGEVSVGSMRKYAWLFTVVSELKKAGGQPETKRRRELIP